MAQSADVMRQLRSTLGKLELALGSIDEAIIWEDGEGRIQWCNAAFDRLMGRPHLELLGQEMAGLLALRRSGRAVPEAEHPARLALSGEGDVSGCYEHGPADRARALSITARRIQLADEADYAVIVIRDITAAQQADTQLRLAATIVEASSDPLMACDMAGVIVSWNRGAERCFGYTAQEALGRHVSMMVPQELAQDHRQLLARLARGEQLERHETVRLHKDGRRIDVSLTLAPIRSASGEIIGVSGTMQEISQRKQLERQRQRQHQAQELVRSSQELARQQKVMHSLLEDLQQAKDRADAQHQQLRASNKRLEEMAGLKDEFVAKASHELRSPLTAIKEGISLMLDEALGAINEEQRDFLSTVDENIDRLTELISNMLDLSKIEAGRMRLMRQRLDLRGLIDSTLNSYKLLAGRRTLKAEFGEVPQVFADSNRVLQVLGNLFSNALKFTKDDGTIAFSLRQQDGHVVVSVRDDGMGMEPSELPKLFQKFSQVGEGENRPKGTGLGLALCKELVELHRGAIRADSTPGQGTTFTFTLPIFTPTLALQESFRELVELSKQGQSPVCVVALDASPLMRRLAAEPSGEPGACLERIAEVLRRNLHRGDVVLGVEPHWLVVLAMTDAEGARALSERLRKALGEWDALKAGAALERVSVGVAVYPADGPDIARLLARATGTLREALGTPA